MKTALIVFAVLIAATPAVAAKNQASWIHQLCEPGAGYTRDEVNACIKDLSACPKQTVGGIFDCAHRKGYPAAEGDDF